MNLFLRYREEISALHHKLSLDLAELVFKLNQVFRGERAVDGLTLTEVTTPDAGDTNTARLFCRDNGSGKTELCVRFPTGAVQVIETEP